MADIPKLIKQALAAQRTRQQHRKPTPAPHTPETTRAGNTHAPSPRRIEDQMGPNPADAPLRPEPRGPEVPNPPYARVFPPPLGIPSKIPEKIENSELYSTLSPEAISILEIMADPEFVGTNKKSKYMAAGVDAKTWRKYELDQDFRIIADMTVRDAMVGRHRELIAIAFKFAREGSMKHFEWLSKQLGVTSDDPRKTLEGTAGGDLHLHLHNATEEELQRYARTGEWTASSFRGIPAAVVASAEEGVGDG